MHNFRISANTTAGFAGAKFAGGALGARLQRRCACGRDAQPGGTCAECGGNRDGKQQKRTVDAENLSTALSLVEKALQSPSQALDNATRARVDKFKSGCKPVPAATIDFGFKGPLSPGTDTDPSKRDSSYIGGTITIPF